MVVDVAQQAEHWTVAPTGHRTSRHDAGRSAGNTRVSSRLRRAADPPCFAGCA